MNNIAKILWSFSMILFSSIGFAFMSMKDEIKGNVEITNQQLAILEKRENLKNNEKLMSACVEYVSSNTTTKSTLNGKNFGSKKYGHIGIPVNIDTSLLVKQLTEDSLDFMRHYNSLKKLIANNKERKQEL